MPANTVKVDRSTPWGNPFALSPNRSADQAVKLYRRWITKKMGPSGIATVKPPIALRWPADQRQPYWTVFHELDLVYMQLSGQPLRQALRGKNLACWCPLDAPCHADVLLEIANR